MIKIDIILLLWKRQLARNNFELNLNNWIIVMNFKYYITHIILLQLYYIVTSFLEVGIEDETLSLAAATDNQYANHPLVRIIRVNGVMLGLYNINY